MNSFHYKGILIIEDDYRLARALQRISESYSEDVRHASNISGAKKCINKQRPELLLLDFSLPDGNGLDLFDPRGVHQPARATIAISARATPADTFRLAQLGVRAFLEKPLSLTILEEAMKVVATSGPEMAPLMRSAVGSVPLKAMEATVRETMVCEALGRSGGSRRGAARLLGVSRQFLQHVLRQ